MTARNQLEVPVPYGIAECNGGILRRGNQLRLIVISKGIVCEMVAILSGGGGGGGGAELMETWI